MMIDLNKAQIQNRLDLTTAANAVRSAYIASAQGQVQAPPVTYLGFDAAQGDCHVKSGYIAGSPSFVIKIATGFYRNPDKGLPSSNGMNLVFSAETGETLAVLRDEGWLTDIRTGIGGALATIALAQSGFDQVLLVGAGLQCRYQARCLQHLTPDRELSFVIWARDPNKAQQAAKELCDEGLSVTVTEDLEAACRRSGVIVTTTPSQSALILNDWIAPGTHITAVGADCPGKQELDPKLVARAEVKVCDLASQSLDHGEFQTLHASGKLEVKDVMLLGDILAGTQSGRTRETDITIVDLTGLAAQDAAISTAVLGQTSL